LKKSLIALGIILLCIIIIAVGCSEQIKFWYDPSIISDPNRVWIDDEHDIWFVFNLNNLEFYGQIVIDSNTYNFEVGTWHHSSSIKFCIDFADDRRIHVLTSGKYYGDKLILTVDSGNPSIPIPDGTKLVFKPYPRQAEHYLK
jgi:hypothetical protein